MKATGANKPLEQLRYAALAARDQNKAGIRQLRQRLVALRDTGDALLLSHWLDLLATAYGKGGQADKGLDYRPKR